LNILAEGFHGFFFSSSKEEVDSAEEDSSYVTCEETRFFGHY
jgi:hypothetical protein